MGKELKNGKFYLMQSGEKMLFCETEKEAIEDLKVARKNGASDAKILEVIPGEKWKIAEMSWQRIADLLMGGN